MPIPTALPTVTDNLRTLTQNPLGNSTTYAYDKDKRLTSTTDALGRVRNLQYDSDGNRLGETWLNAGGTVANTFTFTYDLDNNLTSAANNVGAYTFGYDEGNHLTSETTPQGVSLSYGYDTYGNQTLVEDSLGGTLLSSYDVLNRLTSRQFGDGTNQLRFDELWTARSQLASLTRYSDTAATNQVGLCSYTYDPAGHVQSINHTGAFGASLASYSYGYDPGGRLTAESDNGGATIVYGYDNANQLLGDGTRAYTYDNAGTRNNAGFVPGGAGTGNELQSGGGWAYTYDKAGNEVQKSKTGETVAYSYDQANHLTQAVDVTATGTTSVFQAGWWASQASVTPMWP